MPRQTARHQESLTLPLALRPTQRFLPLLLLLFVGSGCAALMYEIVWFQLIQFVIGSSAVSLGVLLAAFMGGMCLGSLLLPRAVSPERDPLRVYAMLEAAIGVLGLLVLLAVPLVGSAYAATSMQGLLGILSRGLVCAICLLPPTLLMCATLPAIARWVETTPVGVSWLGFFYGSNIAGAVCGCLFAGFYLLRVGSMVSATLVAVVINLVVAAVGLLLPRRAPHRPAVQELHDGIERAGSPWIECRVRRDRTVRHERARCRGRVDSHPFAHARRVRLQILDYSRSVSRWARPRRQCRACHRARPAAARSVGILPAVVDRRNRLVGIYDGEIPSLLADQSLIVEVRGSRFRLISCDHSLPFFPLQCCGVPVLRWPSRLSSARDGTPAERWDASTRPTPSVGSAGPCCSVSS